MKPAPPVISVLIGQVRSCRETKVDDVAIADLILLALESDLAMFATGGIRAVSGGQRVKGHDLGPDESAGDVAVDLAGGLPRRRAPRDGPRPAFVFTDREEGNVAEQSEAGAE